MKKNYKRFTTVLIVLCLGTLQLAAQPLSGLYTINSNQTTGGTNYQTFTDFANDINTNGVSGAVTVNVASGSGPYVEQVMFDQISGVNATNKVTINGNGNTITFSSSNTNQRYTIGYDGTDHFTINDLVINGTGTYAYPVLLFGGANNNAFIGCTVSVPISATSSNVIPIVISGSSTSYASSSTSGSNNLFESCTVTGGWAAISFYGNSSAPRDLGNKIYNCTIGDFYNYGIRTYYTWENHIMGNTIERLTRTSVSTTYGLYSYYSQGSIYENNLIHRLFDVANNASATTYCMYFYNYFSPAPTPGGSPNICRNNIVADIRNNSTLYGMYAYYFDGIIHHNTISLDHSGATSGTTYGLYVGSQTGQPVDVRNNMVSISRGGTGTKYGIYLPNSNDISVDYNNVYIGSTSGTNYHGYASGTFPSLALWQGAGYDANGYDLDPMFVSLNDVHPTNTAVNNKGDATGLALDHEDKVRNQTTPDIGAFEFLTPACSGTPPSNSVSVPLYAICPGENVNLALGNLIANSGFTYQWQTSTISSVGPFTPVSGANGIFYNASNVTQNTWYSIVMTCTAPGGGSISAVGQVTVAGPVSSTVPYYEGFENIGKANRLPNCSWSATNLGDMNQTYVSSASNNRVPRTGNAFAAFSNAPTGTSYFFTNPIQMNTGITYSAALWYATEYFGYANWSELAILVGPNQNTTGLVQVASVSPAISGPYALLDHTFTIPSAGPYYVAIKATSSSGNAYYLSWDDLSITIPCVTGGANMPVVSLSASSNSICQGQQVNITATGADTFSWSTGSTANPLVASPAVNTTYQVYGTNQLTGCTATLSQQVIVSPSPQMMVIADNPIVCAGEPVVLTAFGADSYMWTTGAQGPVFTDNPSATKSYTVNGSNFFGCQTEAVIQVTVNALPSVSATSTANNNEVCADDLVTLQAFGAQSYMWSGSVDPQLYQGAVLNFSPLASDVYTVTGTDQNGCKGMATLNLMVLECTGISAHTMSNVFSVMPNPTAGRVVVEFTSGGEHLIIVTDLSGREAISFRGNDASEELDLSGLSNGVYALKVITPEGTKVTKVVKQ